jgi:hypothetical protein
VHQRHEEERLQGGVAQAKRLSGSDYSDDRSPSSWTAAGREDNDLFFWEEVPKEKTPEGPNGGGDPDDGGNSDDGNDPGNVGPFEMHPLLKDQMATREGGVNRSR